MRESMGTLIAQPFDEKNLELTGEAVSAGKAGGLLFRVRQWRSGISNLGNLFGNCQIVWFDRT
jgi:hypothetical protein